MAAEAGLSTVGVFACTSDLSSLPSLIRHTRCFSLIIRASASKLQTLWMRRKVLVLVPPQEGKQRQREVERGREREASRAYQWIRKVCPVTAWVAWN